MFGKLTSCWLHRGVFWHFCVCSEKTQLGFWKSTVQRVEVTVIMKCDTDRPLWTMWHSFHKGSAAVCAFFLWLVLRSVWFTLHRGGVKVAAMTGSISEYFSRIAQKRNSHSCSGYEWCHFHHDPSSCLQPGHQRRSFSWPCKCVVILHAGGGCAVGCILLPHLVSLMSVCIDC